MKQKTKRYVSGFLLGIMLLSVLFSGCKKEEEIAPSDVVYDFSVYFGSGADQIEIGELLDQYRTEKGIAIEPIYSDSLENDFRDLERALVSANPPAAFVVATGEFPEAAFLKKDGYIKGVSPAAFELIGRGFVVDRRMLSGLVAAQESDAFMEALFSAEYAEWMNFVVCLDAYIKKNEIGSFTLGGQTFTFREKKGDVLRDLNGVFAIEGGGTEFYGAFLLDQAFFTTTPQAIADALTTPTASAFALVDPPFSAYIQGLNDLTSYLAGSYSAGVRGNDFVSGTNYGYKQTLQIFADGKALFLPIESGAFADISERNADRAANLIFIPFKLPYTENGVVAEKNDVKVNASLALSVRKEIYVNAKASKEEQSSASNFVQWFSVAESARENSLESAMRTRLDQEQVIYFSNEEKFAPSFSEAAFSKNGISKYLKIKPWDDQTKQEIKNYLLTTWYEA
ncbi:MAG: hypothetical protein LBU41_01695 [Clostridiales Family XIII bacterium]|jgi:hypothetical protein|nr:hypothetical protein [Clostridiales Family XIII bacterium]